MALLALQGVSLHFGAADVLEDVNLVLEPGMKSALVGENGSGKSSLLALLAGTLDPSAGSIERQRGLRIARLEQLPDYDAGSTALDVVFDARPELAQLRRNIAALDEAEMNDDTALLYAELVAEFQAGGGYEFEARCRQALAGLGLAEEAAERPLATLSGGELARCGLARALLTDCDLLLLDEPDNHLDIDGIRWLEQALVDYPGSLLVASHDRELLDSIANCVVDLEDGTARLERGSLEAYFERKRERIERQKLEYLEQQRRVEKLRASIRGAEQQARGIEHGTIHFHYRKIAKKIARTAVVRKRRLERELASESSVEEPVERSVARLDIGSASHGTSGLLWLDGISAGYGEQALVSNASLTLKRGQRLAITGRNGSGKSTLLKCITGELEPMTGEAWIAGSASVFYCDQQQAGLDHELSLYEQLELSSPLTANQIHYLLARIGLKGRSEQLVGTLSGGERTRLLLSVLMNTHADLLILDEPSNHLDLPSIEVLQAALVGFSGGVLLVSHDRHLVQHVATYVFELKDGRLSPVQ
ncbi:ABC-F family ATP-binding cassette domain-containing protein [bacterium]|nr:ABC-F family ATP-binding cassette domain-containing protein [bacterium]UNM07444.1 MAG: ABC-F family ATP-binding cassette domain-containing protein [Planctomycetales bacterium]